MRDSRMGIKERYVLGRAIMRSIPTQFWPAEMKTPRRRMDAISGSLWHVVTSSRIIAGSLPPSSTHTGVRLLAADVQTA